MESQFCRPSRQVTAKKDDSLSMEYYGHQWPKDYENEFYRFLCLHETKRKSNLMLSPQKEYRADLIQFMRTVCKSCKLSVLTLHLAAYLMDSFMDSHRIKPHRLRFVAASSLSLAAKFEENGGGVPSYGRMYLISNPYQQPVPPLHILCLVEWKIFRFMDHNLHIPTAAHFVYYLLVKGLRPADLEQRPDLSERELRMALRDLLQQSLDDMLDDLWSLKVLPSQMASASLLYARRRLGLYPEWPEELVQLTGLTVDALMPALAIARKYYSRDERAPELPSPNDSGYLSVGQASPCSSTGNSFSPLFNSPSSALPEAMSQTCPMSQEMSPYGYYPGDAPPAPNPLFEDVFNQLFSQEPIDMQSP